MNPNDALTYVTLIGAAGTAVNVFLTLKIANSISKVQLWAQDKFVAKEDLSRYIRASQVFRKV